MTPREVTDGEGTVWSCVQAYAGLAEQDDNKEKSEAARVKGANDKVYVVCTPTGGAQTVRLELPSDWETALSDEDLTREIQSRRESK